MTEQAIIKVHAKVLQYDDATKKWMPSGSSKHQGVSLVQILKNVQLSTFRVVGTKLQDHEVVLNSLIGKNFKYSLAPPTFLQWRDQNVVYGLNFLNAEDASAFGTAMVSAVESLSVAAAGGGQVHAQNGFSTVSSAPNFRQMANNNVTHLEVQDDSIDSCRPIMPLQRRASQSSNASSGSTGSLVPAQSNVVYSSTAIGSSSAAVLNCANQPHVGSTPVRAAPPAPPPAPPLQQGFSRSAPPGQPTAHKAAGGAAPPAPPPLPPSDAVASSWQNKPTNLAQALATAKLRKTYVNEDSREGRGATWGGGSGGEISVNAGHRFGAMGSNSSIGGGNSAHSDIISDLTATLAKRRLLQENASELDSKAEDRDSRKPAENKNGRFATGNQTDSPKTHRKVPSGSSLSSQEETLSSLRSLSNGNASVGGSGGHGTLSPDALEQLKQEILASLKQEITRAKSEIIEAIKEYSVQR